MPSSRTLLVVDANPHARETPVASLEGSGFEVVRVDPSRDVAALVQTHRPVLVLIDMDGRSDVALGLLRRLKADPAFAEVPVVLLSTDEASLEDDDLAALADGFIASSASGPDLRMHVRALLRQRELLDRLRASEARFRDLITHQADGVVVVDRSRRIRYANPAAERLFGQPDATLVDAPFNLAVADDGRREIELQRPDGLRSIVQMRAVQTDWEGEPAWIVTLQDVTELVEAEEALRERDALLAGAQRIGRMGTWIMDLRQDRLVWSDATCALFGVDPETFVVSYENFRGLILPDDLEQLDASHQHAISSDGVIEAEYRIRRPDGQVRWMFERGAVELDDTGTPVRRLGMVMDVTERKQAEEERQALLAREQAAQQRSRLILNAVAEGIHGLDTDGCVVFENPAALAMFGWKEQEMIGKNAHEIIHHHRADGTAYPPDECPIYLTLRDGQVRRVTGEVFYRKDGSSFPVEYGCAPVIDDDGTISGAVVNFTDVSERVWHERLRASEKDMRDAISSGAPLPTVLEQIALGIEALVPDLLASIVLLDPDGLHLRHGAAPHLPEAYVHSLDGLPIGPQAGSCGTAMYQHRQVIVTDIETDPLWDAYRALARPYGLRACWSTPVLDADGQVLGSLAMYYREPRAPTERDLDVIGRTTHLVAIAIERVRRAEALRESEERFRQLAETIEEVFWLTDPVTREVLYVSPGYETIWGYPCQQLYANPAHWIETVHEEDRERVQAAKKRQPARTYDEEYRIVRPDGTVRWISDRAFPIHDASGTVYRIAGNSQDITARKRAEAERMRLLRELGERVKELRALHQVAELLQEDLPPLALLERVASILPQSMQFPEHATARLVFGTDEATTPGFRSATSLLEKRFVMSDGTEGTVQIAYSTQVEPQDDPFLHEERILTESIAEMLRSHFERRRSEAHLRTSEERFRLLSRATNDTIWDWNLLTDALWWNDGIEVLFGYRRDEIEPTIVSWTSRVHPDDREKVVADVRSIIEGTASSWADEYRFRRSDGTYAYVLDRSHVIRDADGRAVRMIGGMTDLTERKQAEQRLAQQAALLDRAHDAILVRDLDHQIVYWNQGAERLYGWTADEARYQSIRDLLYDEPAVFDTVTEATIASGEWQGELTHRTKSGETVIVLGRWTLMHDEAGRAASILAINTDITERKKLEERALRAQRMESIGTLAGGIAHDLNNVLAPILLSVELLQLDETDPERASTLASIEANARRGGAMVRQVLSFARGETGERQTVQPLRLVNELGRIIHETFPRNISFRVEAPDDLWTVQADPTQIHQVLMNLSVNARDAMPEGGILKVRLENVVLDDLYSGMTPQARPGPYVFISMEDTGNGIPHAVRDRIFEPFFTTKSMGGGTGLGLSTSLAIVTRHGGFINVYSEPGRGSTFNVYLPAQTDADATKEVAAGQARLPHGNGELVLVVDDEESIRTVVQKTLERFGYRVMLASNGAEAVSLYAQHRTDVALVLTDMVMPVMDGPSTIVALRVLNPGVRIVGSSGLDANGNVAKAADAGVQHFVSKPYTSEALLRTIHRVLNTP